MLRTATTFLRGQPLRGTLTFAALLVAMLGVQLSLLNGHALTAQLTNTVAANWSTPYDLEVFRSGPGGAIGTAVPPNALTTMHGGISVADVEAIRSVPGVAVAAPVGVVGFVDIDLAINLDVSTLPRVTGDMNAYRVETSYLTDGGLSTVPGRVGYGVVAGRQGPYYLQSVVDTATLDGREVFCPADVECLADAPTRPASEERGPFTPNRYYYVFRVEVPLVAVDPQAEQALLGVNQCVAGGRFLTSSDSPYSGPQRMPEVPVAVNIEPDFGEQVAVSVAPATDPEQLLPLTPSSGRPSSRSVGGALAQLHWAAPTETRYDLNSLWIKEVGTGSVEGGPVHPALITEVSPADVTGTPPVLTAQPATGDVLSELQYWPFEASAVPGDAPPASAADVPVHGVSALTPQVPGFFGSVDSHVAATQLDVVGSYRPSCLPGASELRRMPSDIYAPSGDHTAGGRSFGVTDSPTGFVNAEPLLMTNLAGGAYFSDPQRYGGALGTRFLSAVRVKVAGTSQPGPDSEARLAQAAATIRARTGLDVEIVKGESPLPATVSMPQGLFGRPAVNVIENWTDLGAGFRYAQSVNATSLLMAGSVALVAAIAIAEMTLAGVRRRRHDLSLLRALGWSRVRVASLVEVEAVLLGTCAALAGVAVAWIGGGFGSGQLAVILATPAVVVVSALAGIPAGVAAARTSPARGLSGKGRVRRTRIPARPFTVGLRSAFRAWGWATALGASALGFGSAVVTVLIELLVAFRGSLGPSLLGQTLASEATWPMVALALIALGMGFGATVTGVLLGTEARLNEYATLRAVGWSDRSIAASVAGQGTAIGFLAALAAVLLVLGSAFVLGLPAAAALLGALGCAVLSVVLGACASTAGMLLIRRHAMTRLRQS